MLIYIVRHAIAEERGPNISENERALTEEGKNKMHRVSQGLRKINVRPNVILTSPLRRSLETAQILVEHLPSASLEKMPALSAGAEPNAIISALRGYAKLDEVMLVGHQPDLGRLVSHLLTGDASQVNVDFKKGAVVCVETELAQRRSPAVLLWMLTPKQLRAF